VRAVGCQFIVFADDDEVVADVDSALLLRPVVASSAVVVDSRILSLCESAENDVAVDEVDAPPIRMILRQNNK
jgi:hypothetical protein